MFRKILGYLFLFAFFSYTIRILCSRYSEVNTGLNINGYFSLFGLIFLPFVFVYSLFSRDITKCIINKPYFWLECYAMIVSMFFLILSGEINDVLANTIPFYLPLLTFLSVNNIFKGLDFEKRWPIFLLMFVLTLYQNLFVGEMFLSNLEDNNQRMAGVYVSLFFLPIILLFKKRIIHYFSYTILILLLLFSGRRGGLVGIGISLAIYLLYYMKSKGHAILKFVPVAILLLILYFTFSDYFVESYTVQRFIDNDEYDVTSGRSDIYLEVINLFFNSNVLNMIFGHGMGAVAFYTKEHLTAHNDFLEILFDFGIIGFFLYIRFILSILVTLRKLYLRKSFLFYSFSAWCAIFFTISFVSHIFEYPYFYILMFFMGIFIRLDSLEQKKVLTR